MQKFQKGAYLRTKIAKTHQCTPGRLDFANQQLSTMQPALQNGSVELENCAVEIDRIVLMRAGFQIRCKKTICLWINVLATISLGLY